MATLMTQFVSLFLLAIFGAVSVSAFYYVITELKRFERDFNAHTRMRREAVKTEEKLRRKFSGAKGDEL